MSHLETDLNRAQYFSCRQCISLNCHHSPICSWHWDFLIKTILIRLFLCWNTAISIHHRGLCWRKCPVCQCKTTPNPVYEKRISLIPMKNNVTLRNAAAIRVTCASGLVSGIIDWHQQWRLPTGHRVVHILVQQQVHHCARNVSARHRDRLVVEQVQFVCPGRVGRLLLLFIVVQKSFESTTHKDIRVQDIGKVQFRIALENRITEESEKEQTMTKSINRPIWINQSINRVNRRQSITTRNEAPTRWG